MVARAGFADVVDQDVELERMVAGDWTRLAELRPLAAEQAWRRVPALRAAGTPFVIETTGDKPELLAAEVRVGHAAGYRELGIGLRVPLALCLARNSARARALPESVVTATWHAFERHLADYPRILDAFTIVDDAADLHALAGW
jgi:predicted kinase